jgi:hypothetical protein
MFDGANPFHCTRLSKLKKLKVQYVTFAPPSLDPQLALRILEDMRLRGYASDSRSFSTREIFNVYC